MRARDVAPPFAHTLAASAITDSDAPPMRRRGAAGAVPLYLLAASRQREVPDGARDLAVEQPTQKQSRHIGAETAHICPCAVRICPRTGHVGLGTAFEPLATTLARPTTAAHASVYGSASLRSAALARRLQLKPIGTSAPEFRVLCRSPLKTTFATSRLQPTRAVERCVRRPAAPISVRTAVRLSTQPGSAQWLLPRQPAGPIYAQTKHSLRVCAWETQ